MRTVASGLLFFIVVCLSSAGVHAQWVPWDEMCRFLNEEEGGQFNCGEAYMVRDPGPLPYWAGEVTRMYGEPGKGLLTFEIKVTWITDRSPFKCGTSIKMRPDQVKDFTHRSINMRRCS
jgi:hypothetical protein